MDFDKDAMDWTNIIMTLITSGAFTAIYLLGDRKTASVLENVSKTIDQWQGLLKDAWGDKMKINNGHTNQGNV